MDDAAQYYRTVAEQQRERQQAFGDDFRKQQITQYMQVGNNIHKQIALLLNPDTMQPLPGKEQQVATLRQNMTDVDAYIKKLYDPNFNPLPQGEDPLHKLTDKLHLTHKPQAKPSPDASVSGLRETFGDSTAIDAQTERVEKGRNVENATTLLKKYGATDETVKDVVAAMLGGRSAVTHPPKLSDYATSLRRFVEAEGGDPDNPTAAEEEAFRQQRIKDTAQGHSQDTTRTTVSTDPFGVTTTTKSTLQRRPAGATTGTQVTPSAGASTGATVKQPKPVGTQRKELQSKIGQPRQLDSQGHIPAEAHVNPNLREAANNLLDGMAVKDLPIPQKDKGAAEALAKQYGWKGQGMFTPRDMLLVRESTASLQQLSQADDALSVLDDSSSRLKLAQVLQNPDKRGIIGQSIQTLAAANLTENEQKFVTLYNQAVGRISGLSQLVRSGRATEAQIERLKQELPNPATTASSQHAKDKLKQIQSEIDIALQKGQFADTDGSMSDDQFLLHVSGSGPQ